MQGFIRRQIPLFLRRALTMAPALILLAIGVNASAALVLSQVVLSFGIPFALIPLLLFCRNRELMGALVNRRITTVAAIVAATRDHRAERVPAVPRPSSPSGYRKAFVIGTRRSRPNAFGCSFRPGGACRRLYSATSTSRATRRTSSRSPRPSAAISSGAEVALDVGLEDRVEHVVRRQALVVALVVAQLGARRPLDDRGRDPLAGPPPRSATGQGANTSVFGTSLIGANPPAESPYSVV